jgi:NitT/TauT family transport system substrate-binding protein
VQRFVDASAIGWYHYLYGDPSAGKALIEKASPEMTDGQFAYSIGKLRADGIVDSGDTVKLGIGAMTDALWKSFYDEMVKAGVVKAGLYYKRGYTLKFVDKGVGVQLRPK